ncbi:Vitamin B12-binding protein precursor [Stieleria bergensis]|uniref:Vitamin B12-binding protein n=1 Tax=Stieleria bergensis TaxID=2528025 RepID=A0A517T167_9BACT|nr:Vitamin B12-binding protein precursor [Planctomycetes bacterium SV_7m_r]
MKRSRVCNWIVVVLLAVFSGCGADPAGSPGSSSGNSTAAQQDAAVATEEPKVVVINDLEVRDRLDRVVRLDQPAVRIVSLTPAKTELLFALGLGDKVVGVTRNCNYPEQASRRTKVGGGTLESTSVETILSLKPDLVICKWDSHQPMIASLERLKIPACALGAETLDQLFQEARLIGALTDRRQQADELVQTMQAKHQRLTKLVQQAKPEKPIRVFYEVWDDPLMTAAPNSFIGDVLSMAGLENILTETQVRYPKISSETVIAGDPQLILAPTSHFEAIELDSFAARPGWSVITAVKNERIHLVSGDQISRCGPRILDALEEIVLIAYPELDAAGEETAAALEANE